MRTLLPLIRRELHRLVLVDRLHTQREGMGTARSADVRVPGFFYARKGVGTDARTVPGGPQLLGGPGGGGGAEGTQIHR